MRLYGIPYMGSKSKIVEKIIEIFPKADHFYDLFGGGFSITHAMLVNRSKDFKHFHFNEIRQGICELIKDAICGKYSYENFKPKWISREEFLEKKESDTYIKLCWSFGNNGKDYLFGKDIEQYKKSLHQAIVFNEFDETALEVLGIKQFGESMPIKERRFFLRSRIRVLYKDKTRGELERLQQLQQLERLEQLERLQQLERLEQLQQLERLNFYSKSYDEIEILDNSIIYCDPPYLGTSKYDDNKSFNHTDFLNWANIQTEPVFISEYNIDDPRFFECWSIKKRSLFNKDKSNTLIKDEKLYCNAAAKKILGLK